MTQSSESDVPKARPKRRWLRWVRDILLILIVIGLVQWWQSRNLASDLAPPLVGVMLDGSPYQLDPTEGPWLVHFWAEWCPICRMEQDSVAAIAEDYPVITVATTSGTADEVSTFLNDQGVSMPVLMDEDGVIARSWGVNGVPAKFVVGTDGRIQSATMGYSPSIGMRLRLWLAD